MWASFAPAATFTTPAAAHLVRFAGIAPGDAVLDVGTGTGVVAITAARTGARTSADDLTPALLETARENARIAGLPDIDWIEGDAERLPYPDASFDVVLSQFRPYVCPAAGARRSGNAARAQALGTRRVCDVAARCARRSNVRVHRPQLAAAASRRRAALDLGRPKHRQRAAGRRFFRAFL